MPDMEYIADLRRHAATRKRLGGSVVYGPLPQRPRTRADCKDGPRPCPWVGCRHHLFLEVTATGSIRYRASSDLNSMQGQPSCALDEADRGPQIRPTIAKALGLTGERVRQLEVSSVAHLASANTELRKFND